MLRHAGFSLIELIMVVIILGLLATGTYILWPGLALNLSAQASQISHAIHYAQSLSMSTGQRYRFVKLSATTYEVTDSSGNPIILPSGSTVITLNSGITFGTWVNLPNNLVAFDGIGKPYTDTGSPGTALSATASISLVAEGQTKTIQISPITGRLLVQ